MAPKAPLVSPLPPGLAVPLTSLSTLAGLSSCSICPFWAAVFLPCFFSQLPTQMGGGTGLLIEQPLIGQLLEEVSKGSPDSFLGWTDIGGSQAQPVSIAL